MRHPTESIIREALRRVVDPDLQQDIVSLGMVEHVTVEPFVIKVRVRLTTPLCPLQDRFRTEIESVVKEAIGDEWGVEVDFTAPAPTVPPRVPVQTVWMVASGKGGVGKSTVAFLLAHALRAGGRSVAFLDADVTGPSLPALMHPKPPFPHVEQRDGQTFIDPVERNGIQWMSAGFIVEERFPMAWRGPIVSKTLLQLVFNTRWRPADVLLIDLPPGTGDVQLTLLEHFPEASAIIVTTPHMLALQDVERTVEMFRIPRFRTKLLGVIENMAYYEPRPGERHYPFGRGAAAALEAAYRLPLLGELPIAETLNRFPLAVERILEEFVFLLITNKALRREGTLATLARSRRRANAGKGQ